MCDSKGLGQTTAHAGLVDNPSVKNALTVIANNASVRITLSSLGQTTAHAVADWVKFWAQ